MQVAMDKDTLKIERFVWKKMTMDFNGYFKALIV